ncbi:ribonucleoside-diphosphate reductase [Halorarius halobius]|uniref:ribonucleoside-diphosphate reductase n=1 Tax=Halorarius halobius TaxID=2962671 RepID=UPI0020CF22A9|nr:ribonucleoside-diphosphate reductase [Halorarius halobius]
MNRYADATRSLRLDPESQAGGYFKHAVYNHWDPYEDIPEELLERDRQALLDAEFDADESDGLAQGLALFGAGEEAVTEDLAPLSMVLDDIDDQMFISSQIYEEAKHTQFFDRYWRDVLVPVCKERGWEVPMPTDDEFFMDDYVALFDDVEAAMHRLLEEDTPENRVRAYCHYHLVVESVLAQTGYFGLTSAFQEDPSSEIVRDDAPEIPHLPGLVEGLSYIRSDEGRHVGWGMHKVQQHIREDDVDPQVVRDTLQSLMGNVANIVSYEENFVNPVPLVGYARDKLTRRIEIITDASAEIPDVDELVALDTSDDLAAGD